MRSTHLLYLERWVDRVAIIDKKRGFICLFQISCTLLPEKIRRNLLSITTQKSIEKHTVTTWEHLLKILYNNGNPNIVLKLTEQNDTY